MADLGLIPALLFLLCIGAMASYTGVIIGQFKKRHAHIHSWSCAGETIFGKRGGRVLRIGQLERRQVKKR